MRVPMLDLQAQFAEVETSVRKQLEEVLSSQHFILGPKVAEFEAQLAQLCGTAHAIGVSSGTDAILLALMALGVGPSDEVITTPFSFFATIGGVLRLGARPVFVDIDPATMNLDISRVRSAIGPRTKAILPVHLFGRPVAVEALREIVAKEGIPIIEDAAQAIGAERGGLRAGSLGSIGCFSFFPSKNLGAFGDAGATTTNDDSLATKMRLLRAHGASPKYFHQAVGGNFRLDALQAAVLLAKMPYLDAWTQRRSENAARYDRELERLGLVRQSLIDLPPATSTGDKQVVNQYVIRAKHRDALATFLKDRGVQTEIYYPLPLHLQPCLEASGYKPGDFPVAETTALSALALPVAPEIPLSSIEYVAASIADFYAHGAGRHETAVTT